MKSKASFTVIGTILFALTTAPMPALGQDVATPGPEHEMLKRLAGTWDAKVKSGGAESAGTSTSKMECGGLWLITDFHGEFGSLKFQGRGMDGYDPGTKKFVSVWVDSMSVRPMTFEGTYDKEKKTMTMTGSGPGSDGATVNYKSVTHMPDDDHQTFTMFVVGADGGEFNVMTIDYARRK